VTPASTLYRHTWTTKQRHTPSLRGWKCFSGCFSPVHVCRDDWEGKITHRGGSTEYRPKKEVKNDVGDIWKISKQISPYLMVGRNTTFCLAREKETENRILKDIQIHHLFLLLAQTILRPWSITNHAQIHLLKSQMSWYVSNNAVVCYCPATRHDTEIPIQWLNVIHIAAFIASH